MRRLVFVVAVCLAAGTCSLFASAAGAAMFSQCPAVDKDTGCQFLFTVTDSETAVQSDTGQGPYEGADDALIGIANNSSKTLSSIPIQAEIELFGFERDGICSPGEGPIPSGCVILTKNAFNETPLVNKPGEKCKEPTLSSECGFPEAEGGEEPEKSVTFPEGQANGFGAKGNQVTGYEGPRTWYTNIGSFGSFPTGSGTVHFSPPLKPGESTYFGLESPPTAGFGSASTLTTTLSGGGQSGASITVVQGTGVTDSATLGGTNASAATGTVNFNVYSDTECKNLVTAAGTAKLSSGSAGPSSSETLAPGKYYWRGSYGGSASAQPASSTCGGEVLTVLAATTTSTAQTGGGITGASLTVPSGTAVSDRAGIAGALAASATGTVNYVLYKDSKCTIPLAAGSSVPVVAGAAAPSAPLKAPVGKYYWLATYSGDGANAPSASPCGSEVLVVAKKTPLGLSIVKGCVSKRHFVIHPKAPRGVRLVSVREYINGVLVLTGKLTRRHTTVNLRGLPKGSYKVELVATSSSGKLYEDTRTFHTCVTGHHKKKKKK